MGSVLSFGSQIERVKRYSRLDGAQATVQATRDSVARIAAGLCLAALALPAYAFGLETAGTTVLASAGVYVGLGTQKTEDIAKGRLVCRRAGNRGKDVYDGHGLSVGSRRDDQRLQFADRNGHCGIGVGVSDLAALRPALSEVRCGLTWVVVRRQWSNSLYYGLASVTPALLLLDSSVVLALSDSTQAGYLSVGSKLVGPLSIATGAIVAALLPFFVRRQIAGASLCSWIQAEGRFGLVPGGLGERTILSRSLDSPSLWS